MVLTILMIMTKYAILRIRLSVPLPALTLRYSYMSLKVGSLVMLAISTFLVLMTSPIPIRNRIALVSRVDHPTLAMLASRENEYPPKNSVSRMNRTAMLSSAIMSTSNFKLRASKSTMVAANNRLNGMLKMLIPRNVRVCSRISSEVPMIVMNWSRNKKTNREKMIEAIKINVKTLFALSS